MAKTTGRFTVGTNAGTFTCVVCGERRQRGNSGDNDELCIPCWDEAGEINSHSDGYHTDEPSAACPDCTGNPERGSDAWKAAKAAPAPKAEPVAPVTAKAQVRSVTDARGTVKATKDGDTWLVLAEAGDPVDGTYATVRWNAEYDEAGFRGRAWRVTAATGESTVSDDQAGTLKEVLERALAEADSRAKLRGFIRDLAVLRNAEASVEDTDAAYNRLEQAGEVDAADEALARRDASGLDAALAEVLSAPVDSPDDEEVAPAPADPSGPIVCPGCGQVDSHFPSECPEAPLPWWTRGARAGTDTPNWVIPVAEGYVHRGVTDELVSYVLAWYNRAERSWVVSFADADEHQIGSSEYVATKADRDAEARGLLRRAARGARVDDGASYPSAADVPDAPVCGDVYDDDYPFVCDAEPGHSGDHTDRVYDAPATVAWKALRRPLEDGQAPGDDPAFSFTPDAPAADAPADAYANPAQAFVLGGVGTLADAEAYLASVGAYTPDARRVALGEAPVGPTLADLDAASPGWSRELAEAAAAALSGASPDPGAGESVEDAQDGLEPADTGREACAADPAACVASDDPAFSGWCEVHEADAIAAVRASHVRLASGALVPAGVDPDVARLDRVMRGFALPEPGGHRSLRGNLTLTLRWGDVRPALTDVSLDELGRVLELALRRALGTSDTRVVERFGSIVRGAE